MFNTMAFATILALESELLNILGIRMATVLQFSSVTSVMSNSLQPHDCSMPGLPVHHQFPELAQTYVYRVTDAIQPFHPLLSPSLPTFNLSQHQGLL